MRSTYNLSLSPESVEGLIRLLQKNSSAELEKKAETLIERLVKEVGMPEADSAFGGAVQMSAEKRGKNSYALVASGDIVCFLEFGTGAETDTTHPFVGTVENGAGISVRPGSWSESEHGAHTWSKWHDAGLPESQYPYNRSPKRGMYYAYKAITDRIAQIAGEVFGID